MPHRAMHHYWPSTVVRRYHRPTHERLGGYGLGRGGRKTPADNGDRCFNAWTSSGQRLRSRFMPHRTLRRYRQSTVVRLYPRFVRRMGQQRHASFPCALPDRFSSFGPITTSRCRNLANSPENRTSVSRFRVDYDVSRSMFNFVRCGAKNNGLLRRTPGPRLAQEIRTSCQSSTI